MNIVNYLYLVGIQTLIDNNLLGVNNPHNDELYEIVDLYLKLDDRFKEVEIPLCDDWFIESNFYYDNSVKMDFSFYYLKEESKTDIDRFFKENNLTEIQEGLIALLDGFGEGGLELIIYALEMCLSFKKNFNRRDCHVLNLLVDKVYQSEKDRILAEHRALCELTLT